jgi:hypothetical protein
VNYNAQAPDNDIPTFPREVEIVKGDDFRRSFRMTNRARDAMTWTGYAVTLEIWSKPAFGQPAVILYQSANLLDPATGWVNLEMLPATTSALTWQKGAGAWRLTRPDTKSNIIMRMHFKVNNAGGTA